MLESPAPRPVALDRPREAPDVLTLAWLLEHTNMEPTLRAYQAGVTDKGRLGPTRANAGSAVVRERLDILRNKVRITHRYSATFALEPREMHEALCLLPTDWLRHAKLERIEVTPPQYFCFRDMEHWLPELKGNYFIGGVIDGKDADDHFAGKDVPFLKEQNLIGPPTRFHYAPGQYHLSTATIQLWQEPAATMGACSMEARKEMGRELVVHEALHSVFYDKSLLEFFVDGRWQGYRPLMETFHAVCRREPAATTAYSELYLPWLALPLRTEPESHWAEDFRVRSFLQEELGELLSACLRGWGAAPGGMAERARVRDFGGTAFAETGVSEKVAFVDALLKAPVRLTQGESGSVSAIQKETGRRADDATV